MENAIIIGIAGGTGSGKTTLVKRLQRILGNDVVTITHDYYYKPNDHLPLEERKKLNYDHPHAFDTDLLIKDLEQLKSGSSIHRPDYSFVEHTRKKEKVKVNPAKVIIVEGILIFENKQLLDLFDIKVFVDADADIRFIRRLVRDVKERDRNMDSIIDQYLGTVKVMHEQFVEPSKKHADIIIPEGGYNQVALHLLVDRIKSLSGS